MTDLDALKAKVDETEAAHTAAVAAYCQALIDAAPYKVGDIVEVRLHGLWQPAIVRAVTVGWSSILEYTVALRRKNGDWMNQTRGVVDWEHTPSIRKPTGDIA